MNRFDYRRDVLGAAPRRNDEEIMQRSIVEHLKLLAPPEIIWFAVPNGEKRSKATAGRLKAMGVVAGVPDMVFVLKDGTAAFLELKSPTGSLSKDQERFGQRAETLGCPFFSTADLDQALDYLRALGILPAAA